MLTETLSGKCPCCNNDKLFQRYGSMGYFQMDYCPKCGFFYGSNGTEEDFGEEASLGWAKYQLEMVSEKTKEELDVMESLDIRKELYEWTKTQDRFDDIETTIFKYEDEDVNKHMKTKPIIL
jgi:hypothetical protein